MRQEEFAFECARNGDNATAAYRVVYGQGNMSDDSLYKRACLLRAKVKPRIQQIRAELRARSIMDLEESNRILTAIARANTKDLFYKDPKTGKTKMRSPDELSDDTADAIAVMTNSRGVVNYRFHSKLEALKQLAKQNAWNVETVNTNYNSKGERIITFGEFPDSLLDDDEK